ncbi:hypothetical protein [Nonomuraea sp. NPDC003709]|uniref:hypothetical protein n=1 Tax=Nonomuraea sp. NPDC003709 TaxID=3154450 RepID=UPI0033BE250B
MGAPPTVRSIRALILRLIRENSGWGYRRVHGELATLGIAVAPSTVWEILTQAGLDPAPERASTTWADFLRSQANAMLACDFIETVALSRQRQRLSVERPDPEFAVSLQASWRATIVGGPARRRY